MTKNILMKIKIQLPFYQKEWFGIKFSDLNVKLSLVSIPTKIFYDSFYNFFISKYSSFDALPIDYLNEKAQISKYIIKYYSDKKILSYGSGLGVVEKVCLENKVNISAYDSSKETNDFIPGLNYINDLQTSLKYDIIYFSYVLYSMKSNEISKLLQQIKNKLKKDGELIIIFSERESITVRSILRILYIFLFKRLNYQFWGFERNRFFYIELFQKHNFNKIRFDKIHNHSILCFRYSRNQY